MILGLTLQSFVFTRFKAKHLSQETSSNTHLDNMPLLLLFYCHI